MKSSKVISIYCLALLFNNISGQNQYSFPTPSDAYITTLPLNQYFSGYFVGGNHILSGNNMVVPQLKIGGDAKMELKASQSIQIANSSAMDAFSINGGFSAYVSNDVLDISSFHLNGWSNIGRFDRFEIGIKLPTTIDQQVEDFLNGLTGINPYNLDVLRLEGDFQSIATGQTFTREGFYYRNIVPNGNSYIPSKSLYPLRLRFAPPENGSYKFNLRLVLNGSIIAVFNGGQFDVIENNKKGFVTMGNFNHLRDKDGNDFFAIGQDFAPVEQIGSTDLPGTYDTYISMIENLYTKGGNFIRVTAADAPQFSVEWEELGVYGSARKPNENYKRQFRSYELDRVFEKIESRNMYCQLVLVTDQITNGAYGGPPWSASPYSIFGDHGWLNFYENPAAIAQFKKTLRYIHARFGYSSNLALYETHNETNGVGNGSSNSYTSTASTRTKVHDWAIDIANFLKTGITFPTHLTTISYGNITGEFPGNPDNASGDPIYDVRTPHNYGHAKTINKDRFDQAKKFKFGEFMHPAIEGAVLFTELGTSDGWEVDKCFDQEFHNGLWSTSMCGTTGTAYRYGYERNELRDHISSVSTFFTNVQFPFQTNHFNTKYDKKNEVECIFNVNDSGTRGFGWVHNYQYYWAGDPDYYTNPAHTCQHNPPTGSSMEVPSAAGAHLEEITLSGFANISNSTDDFDFEIWSCYGSGGILNISNENVNVFGNVNHVFSVEGRVNGGPNNDGFPDYAFKMYPASDNNFRSLKPDKYYNGDVGVIKFENDTSLSSNNSIPVEPPSDPKIKYHYWDFGNGTTSNDAKTQVVYDKPGNYLVKHSTLNSNNDTVTYIQTIVVRSQRNAKIDPADKISVYPNPTNTEINIKYGFDNISNVKLIDNTGRVIMNINSMPDSIDLKTYPVGIYQLLFFTEKEIISKKIIKQ